MSLFTDLRRRNEPPPTFVEALLPPALRSEAFAEDLADLLMPAPLPLADAPAAAPRAAASPPRPWLGGLVPAAGALRT